LRSWPAVLGCAPVKNFFRLSLLGLAAAAEITAAQVSVPTSAVRSLGTAFADVYDRLAPSVVVLEVARDEEPSPADAFAWQFLFPNQQGPRNRPPVAESEGSGFVIREDGYILTNAHVIEGADPRRGVVARRKDGSRVPLTVVGVDAKTDLAVLKAEGTGWPAVTWGDSDAARVGEFVCSLGAPFELDYTLTVGVLSAKGRSNLTTTAYEDYLQTDAAINPGNSGGPLCNLDGAVIGVNTLINGISRGLGFAIPAKIARAISEELIATGRVVRPWLGIRIETLSEEPGLQQMMGLESGVVVRSLEPDAPAVRSELRPADVIVEIDGQPVTSARDLQQAVLTKGIGQTVNLKVWRRGPQAGAYRTVSVQTEELPEPPVVMASGPRAAPFRAKPPAADGSAGDEKRLGLEVEDLTEAMARETGVSGGGVIVTYVAEGSVAGLAGVRRGDVITSVRDTAVRDIASFDAALDGLAAGEEAMLLIERGGQKTYAIVRP